MSSQDITDAKRSYRTARTAEFGDSMTLSLTREAELRYGENPNQLAMIARLEGSRVPNYVGIELVKSGKGGWSATNYMDVCRGLEVLKFFKAPSAAVMKHTIPSGFATQYNNNKLREIYAAARDADKRSAFGSIVVLNRPLDKETAEEIMTTYVEGVAAPEFEQGVVGMFEPKKDLRLIRHSGMHLLPKFVGDNTEGLYDIKALPTGRVLVQEPYLTSIKGVGDLITHALIRGDPAKETTDIVVARGPTEQELEDMLTAWWVNVGAVRSNGIVFVMNGVTVAVGSGQQERVGAVEQAIVKAYQKAADREGITYHPLDGAVVRHALSTNPLKGAVVSSDAFFPFRDSIDTLASVGVSAIIQPAGSVRDREIIEALNEHDMAMAATLERCFGHF